MNDNDYCFELESNYDSKYDILGLKESFKKRNIEILDISEMLNIKKHLLNNTRI